MPDCATLQQPGVAADGGQTAAADAAAAASGTAALPVPWSRRPDLIVRPHDGGAWIVRDPLTDQFLLLTDPEVCVLRMLDGQTSVARITQRLQASWPEAGYVAADVADLTAQLAARRLILARCERLAAPVAEPPRSAGLLTGFLYAASRMFRMRFRLWDPSRLLRQLAPVIQRVYSRRGAMIVAGLLTAALLVLLVRFEEFVEELPGPADFFGPGNLLLLFILFVAVKACHELGHMTAAQHAGVECREAGVLLLFLTPVLYTNVSQAWHADRHARLLITAAGMLVELVLAAVCLLLWAVAAPGMTRALLANTAILCSVGTVLFNGNPLLRYDGYFLLADAARRPNLGQQATACLQSLLERLLFGPDPQRPFRWDPFLLVYGLLSGGYRLLLTLGILAMLLHLLDRWQLQTVGLWLAGLAAIVLVLTPALQSGSRLLAGLLEPGDRPRRLLRAGLVTAGCVSLLLIPLPYSLTVPGVVEPSGQPLFTTRGGRFVSSVPYGSVVRRGTVVVTLEDGDLLRRLQQLDGELRRQELLVQSLQLRRDPREAALLPEAREVLAACQARRDHWQRQAESLLITASRDGVLLPPRQRPSAAADMVTLTGWLAEPLQAANVGGTFEPGTWLGTISDAQTRDVLLAIDAADVHMLQPGQSARFCSATSPGQTLPGEVQSIAALELPELPTELLAAGLLPPADRLHPRGNPRYWQAAVRIQVSAGQSLPVLYSTGYVRIELPGQSLLQRVRRYLRSVFG